MLQVDDLGALLTKLAVSDPDAPRAEHPFTPTKGPSAEDRPESENHEPAMELSQLPQTVTRSLAAQKHREQYTQKYKTGLELDACLTAYVER